jgi:hypothetical protein
MEVKILLCLHLASFMTNYFTSSATFFRQQASNMLENHYLKVIKYMYALYKEVRFYSFLRHNVPLIHKISVYNVNLRLRFKCLETLIYETLNLLYIRCKSFSLSVTASLLFMPNVSIRSMTLNLHSSDYLFSRYWRDDYSSCVYVCNVMYV